MPRSPTSHLPASAAHPAERPHAPTSAMPAAGRRELDARSADGLTISLLWDPADDRVAVSVVDARTGVGFEVDVHPGEAAMDVFHHPFASAALRRGAVRAAANRPPSPIPPASGDPRAG